MDAQVSHGPGAEDGRLEVLWQDGERALYRELRAGHSRSVLALRLTADSPSPASVDRLAHEYELKDQLESGFAARPVELVRDGDRTILVLEDPGGEPLDRHLGEPMQAPRSLRLAISIAGALRQVHQRGLVHKDLKPAHILVDSANGHVSLTGFGLASRLRRERQDPSPPEFIAGTLAYMAPEQTGRMNRSIDSRSDLYSLGALLYEMLTGTLPFTASDPMEWIHCHIARQPMPPDARVNAIPAPVAAIVMKLLAKTAEDRYQTAAGVESDLQRCLAEWELHGRVDPFQLGANDTPDWLLIPEKLYGRSSEIDSLLASFDRVVESGKPELVLVSGYSGIGKSSVVNELHKELVPPRGLFASGKFDQYKRDIPYATLAQALRTLVRQILVKSEAAVNRWRRVLTEAVEPNGRLIIGLVPEAEFILDDSPPVPDLPPRDAQNRFRLVLRRFLGAFAKPEHPLALFLDDLQWLDAATLDLLEDLLTAPEMRSLLLVGAYRDNEVGPSHPLVRTLDVIRKAGAPIREIQLAPLKLDDISHLVADAIHCEPSRVSPLAQMLHQKTGGNPFFVIQFLSTLAEEGLLAFETTTHTWRWDMDRIDAKGYTENIVALMVGKLNRLPEDTQEALKFLACFGNTAPFTTLSMIYKEVMDWAPETVLWEAVRAGFIFRVEGAYAFPHDRIQQAAYSLILDAHRPALHLRIGRALLARMTSAELDEHLFDVTSQINRGAKLLVDGDEKAQAAEMNLRAGRKAKTSTAYTSACAYLAAGTALLSDGEWEGRYPLMFNLWLERAECEFLSGDIDQAERLISILLLRGASKVDLASVYHLKILLHIVKSEYVPAVEAALECLRLFGINLPAHPTWEQVQAEFETVWRNLGERDIDDLIDLPLMTDPDLLAVMRILSVLSDPAYNTDQNLFCLELCRAVNLGMRHGVSGPFAHACGYFARPLVTLFRRYSNGFRFAKLGYGLVEKHAFVAYGPKIQDALGIAAFWTRPMATSTDFVRASFRTGLETGDLTYASYAMHHTVLLLLLQNKPLDAVRREAESARDFVRKARFHEIEDIIVPLQRFIAAMQGRTASISSFSDDRFDEDAFEARLMVARMPTTICWYWITKAKARFLAGAHSEAFAAVDKATGLLWSSIGHIPLLDYYYYAALTLAAVHGGAPAPERSRWEELLDLSEKVRELAGLNPPSFGDKHALVSAEIARLESRELDAMRLYEEAIALAREHGFVQNEGLAHELAAQFYLARGFETIADAYLRNAKNCYLRWEAEGKVRQLEAKHPRLRAEEPTPAAMSSIAASVERLDLATVVKLSQTVSREIVLEKLIDTIMRTAIEQAGAQRGILIVSRRGELRGVAEASTSQEQIAVEVYDIPAAETALPQSVLQYVVRTQEPVVLDDATAEPPFAEDPYISRRQAKSILCLPLLTQAKLVGLLYVENGLAPRVFVQARIAVLRLLASQAAISLENAGLYRDVAEREAKIRRLVDANIIGTLIWKATGPRIDVNDIVVADANDAFLRMVGYDREDLAAGRLSRATLTPPEWSDRDALSVAEVKRNGTVLPFEKEYLHKDGSRVPVLIGLAAFDEQADEGVAFVVDLTERKRSEAEAREAQTALAHANRVAALGQLSASISHEINQPLSGVVTNAETGLLWLSAAPPNIQEAMGAFSRAVRDGKRASAVVNRIRALIKKAPPQKDEVDLNEAILEVVALTRGEATRNGVLVQTRLGVKLPPVRGDRVQLQQVVLNLVVNAVEAIRGSEAEPREVLIETEGTELDEVQVSVRDTGPGIDPEKTKRIFDAFFTTKPNGLGMGLAICRSIVETHGGKLWASAGASQGAVFQFAVPAWRGQRIAR